MTTVNALHTPLSQQALSLVLALLVTAGSLGTVLGLAADDQAALFAHQANQADQTSQAIASMLVAPKS